MANDWYCSSAAYATYTAFQGSHLYSIGNIIVPTAPTGNNKWAFRCTTGGTSTTEPTWSTAPSNNDTITSGGATFTNVTGQSAFFWTAAAGDMGTLQNVGTGTLRAAAGDRIFVSSDHTETHAGPTYGAGGFSSSFAVLQILSVNRAGSTPPVAADLAAGATLICNSGTMIIETFSPCYCYGITFSYTTTSTGIQIASNGSKSLYLDNCQLWLNTATTTCSITTGDPATLIMNNSTVKFGHVSQAIRNISSQPLEIIWQNTASAIAGATIPTVLFQPGSFSTSQITTCRGVDLSGTTNTLVQNNGSAANCGSKFLFDSCKIASAVTRWSTTNASNTRDLVELVNCYDGTNIISESYQVCGTLTTETTITLSGGAVDDVGAFSHKIVTNANVDKFVNPFCSFWMDVENTSTGSPKTATVEIISSTALNNDEIALYLQYEGTAGSSVASFGTNFTGAIATPGAVTTSTATWNSSPSTPQKQKCQVSFTPQHAGRLRGQIRVGKASTTVYINPQIAVT